MTHQQLEYVLAIHREKNFVKAAQSCFVTQATLSMMVRKLEEELGVLLFDRSTKPVVATKEGLLVIRHALHIRSELKSLTAQLDELKGEISGQLQVGIIPTLAPYLLPLFLKQFAAQFSKLKIHIQEMITPEIIKALKEDSIDIGLLATPLNEPGLTEHILFYEEFYAYASKSEKLNHKKYILPQDINPLHLWILEEGHCMRHQLIQFCALQHQSEESDKNIRYEAGSIETLINMVNTNGGITLLPKLATDRLPAPHRHKLYEFAAPKPVREISLVTKSSFPRQQVLTKLSQCIIKAVNLTSPTKLNLIKPV